MNSKEYMEERVDDQINWYDRKSQVNRIWYQSLSTAQIIMAALIPLFAGYITDPTTFPMKFLVGLLGAFTAILAGFLALSRFQEKWIQYRTTAESLKHEKFLFLTHCDPYDVAEPFRLFVQQVENLISKEHSTWRRYICESKDDEGSG